MPNWILKSTIQRTISWLPQSHRWNALLQKKISKGHLASRTTFEGKLSLCQRHLARYRKFSSQPVDELSALELGTGSWPIVPIALFLSGAREIWTYDLVPLLEPETMRHTLSQFIGAMRDGILQKSLPAFRADRFKKLEEVVAGLSNETPASALEKLNIHVRIGDARKTGLPPGSVDLVFSTVVLEHIPGPIIAGLYREFKRVLQPGGVMSHYIGIEDQFASVDSSITPFNFLRYTSAQWKWLNSPIVSQTRLRIQEHRNLLGENGFSLVDEENVLGDPEELRSVPLAPEFRHHSFEDLLVLFSWLTSTPRS